MATPDVNATAPNRAHAPQPQARGNTMLAVHEVTQLLAEAASLGAGNDAATYDHALGKAAMALSRCKTERSSPLAALMSVVREDRRLRNELAVRCQGSLEDQASGG